MPEMNIYYRKTSPEMTLKLWQIINDMNNEINSYEINQTLIRKQMMNTFNIRLDRIQCQQLITDAIDDKLISEYISSRGFRSVLSGIECIDSDLRLIYEYMTQIIYQLMNN